MQATINNLTINSLTMDTYIITYSNSLVFNNRKLAFRKKQLFDISGNVPKLINKSEQGWWVNGKLLTVTNAQNIITNNHVDFDLTGLPWNIQINYDECFNLN